MKQWLSIARHIGQVTGDIFLVGHQQNIAGGSINGAFVLTGQNGEKYFVKINKSGQQAMFEAEARGLQEIASTAAIRVPQPVCFGDDQQQSYIVMEYLEMNRQANQSILGEQLAAMHAVTADAFGWAMDNTIGATPQPNAWMGDWLTFWREQRLGYQLRLAASNGYGGELQVLGERLLVDMPSLLEGREVRPSMLHGDLWGGNVAGLDVTGSGATRGRQGTPVIFDPALYYGDREADLAMTYVFGGFDADFYASYQSVLPLDVGFAVRKTFYNIYHIINHLNLFGGGYHAQAIDMLKRVIAEIS
ncbi:MAG: fructosamine kinase family protein [Gammaproteobacteria bacterium]|nr:fructosamine kinase family protein [Gammaproteobacteria bacterium]